MLRLLRFGLLVILTFLVLGIVVAISGPETGPLEKIVLAVGVAVLVTAAIPVRRLGSTRS